MSERRGTALRQTIADLQERAAKLDSVIASSEAEPENDLIALYNQGQREITQKKFRKHVKRGNSAYYTARRFQVNEALAALEQVLRQQRNFEQLRLAFQGPDG